MPTPSNSSASLRAAAIEAGRGCNCFSLRKAARAVTQLYDDALRPCGLRSTQFTLLALILGHGRIGVSELAAASVSDRTTLTRNLAVLERAGLVHIRVGTDERTRVAELSAAGQSAVAEALPYWRDAQATLAARVGAQTLAALRGELAGIVDAASSGRIMD